MTQKQLADLIHYSVSYISDIERNRTVPALKTLKLISEALEVEISMLLKSKCCYELLLEKGTSQSYFEDEKCRDCPLFISFTKGENGK